MVWILANNLSGDYLLAGQNSEVLLFAGIPSVTSAVFYVFLSSFPAATLRA